MTTLKKRQSLEEELHFVCDQCYYQFAYSRPEEVRKLAEQVDEIKALYDKNILGEEAYHDLLKLAISLYIGNQVVSEINHKLSSAFSKKLSPRHVLESLALAR